MIEIDGTYYNDIKWTGNFKDGMYYKGKMASKVEEYYDNGSLKAEGMQIGDIKLDSWKYYYENGKRKKTASTKKVKKMVNGPHGTKVERKKILDLTLKIKKMVNGERGITMGKGIIKEIIKMVKSTDLGHGGMIMAKKYQGNYDNGKKSGEWFEWASNGELVISGFYKNGKNGMVCLKVLNMLLGKK